MESFLRTEQESRLKETSKLIAAFLQDHTEIFGINSQEEAPQKYTNAPHLYVHPLLSAIQIDGYGEDWLPYSRNKKYFTSNEKTSKDPLSYNFHIGNFARYLYVYFEVNDNKVVYRPTSNTSITQNDFLEILISNPEGRLDRYNISTHSPGKTIAQRSKAINSEKYIADERVLAYWQETTGGYNVELRIPIYLIGDKLSFIIHDVDDPFSRSTVNVLATTNTPKNIRLLSSVAFTKPEVQALLNRLKQERSRIWIIDKYHRVIAQVGDFLDSDSNLETDSYEKIELTIKQLLSGIVRLIYRALLKQPTNEFQDDLSSASRLTSKEMTSTLQGEASTYWRLTPDERVNILTATYPIYAIKPPGEQNIIGAIAIEQTSNSILILQNRAIEILINLSIITFLVATVSLIIFATRLSIRIRDLRNQADDSIGEDGKVKGNVQLSINKDEIGDLSRSFHDIINRLSQYNRYLETMSGKLSHELRTPITVVKSSLENLDSDRIDEESSNYITRAKEGVDRLNNILTRMSEATRIEQTLQSETKELFDLNKVISSCAKGYQLANKNISISYNCDEIFEEEQATLFGSPDLCAQLLDKLVSNAIDFMLKDSDISISLMKDTKVANLSIINKGPLLPKDMQQSLFDSMVSVRKRKASQPHLGLGLYIVRLISEFHDAQVSANNASDDSGVEFNVRFPLANAKT